MNTSLFKKYCNNNLRVLARIHILTKKNKPIYYSNIESYIKRGRNQISAILSKLENDGLIQREKRRRPQQITLTKLGYELMSVILKELT